jgi:hypothetical protein
MKFYEESDLDNYILSNLNEGKLIGNAAKKVGALFKKKAVAKTPLRNGKSLAKTLPRKPPIEKGTTIFTKNRPKLRVKTTDHRSLIGKLTGKKKY